jgi:hypothetical protein
VRRNGKLVIEKRFPMLRFTSPGAPSLKLQNVWGGPDPEALATFETGGNRCCDELNVGPVGGGSVVSYDLPNTGVVGSWYRGTFDFFTADFNFDCTFTDCASESEPLKVIAIDMAGRRFVDVTRSRLDLVAEDATFLRRQYQRDAAHKGYRSAAHPNRAYDAVGTLAPWCADEYRLGRERACARGLAQAAARGYLFGTHGAGVRGARATIRYVQKQLVAWGYAADPPILIPWSRIGDIYLGEAKARVDAEYDPTGGDFHVLQRYSDSVQGTYPVHGSRVLVTFTANRVRDIDFVSPYYRTPSGFGVGSAIPKGPCHTVPGNPCEHQWHGYVFQPRWKDAPCNCWIKVGLGTRPVAPSGYTFLQPWFFIFMNHGRAAEFFFSSSYTD